MATYALWICDHCGDHSEDAPGDPCHECDKGTVRSVPAAPLDALRALEPLVEQLVRVVDLEHGGRLVFTRFEDGSYQLGAECEGCIVRVPALTAVDMREAVHALLRVLA